MIYIHIPYCKQICFYCDFYRVKNKKTLPTFVRSLCQEIKLKGSFYKKNFSVQTIYWGGGTPSLLDTQSFEMIMEHLNDHFDLSNLSEHTLEADPETFEEENVLCWKRCKINRISLGAQSFVNKNLKIMGRTHCENGILNAYKLLKKHNFSNVSVDLLIGTPHQVLKDIQYSLDKIALLNPSHLSVYNLNIEKESLWGKVYQNNPSDLDCPPEKTQIDMLSYLCKFLKKRGYRRYEISNYSKKKDWESQHNWGYWTGRPYIGFGPSAHSYDGQRQRSKNKASILQYCQDLNNNTLPLEFVENLSDEQKHLEELFSRLRTRQGIPPNWISSENLKLLQKKSLIDLQKNVILTEKGQNVYNEILKLLL